MIRRNSIIIMAVFVLIVSIVLFQKLKTPYDRMETKHSILRLLSFKEVHDFRNIYYLMPYSEVVSKYGDFHSRLDESGSGQPFYYLRNGDKLAIYFVNNQVCEVALYKIKKEVIVLLNNQFTNRLLDGKNKVSSKKILPRSGYEITSKKTVWNSTDKEGIMGSTNSYNYALNITHDPRNSKMFNSFYSTRDKNKYGLVPGVFAEMKLNDDYANIVECCIADAKKMRYTFKAIEETEKASKGNYKVALFVSPKHGDLWYRQNPDGTWSYKNKNWPIEDKDFDGDIIYNPREANAGLDVKFMGFFEVGGNDKNEK